MNADEIQYALDRRNQVTLPFDADNVLDKPIQLGHLTGDVFIESVGFSVIGYLGPPGRAVFEYNYTGAHDPPRIFFRGFYCRNTGGGTYNVTDVSFFRVIQPNTSPKAIFIEHCNLGNNRSYLIDGPDVSGCDGIQIKNSEGGGSCFLRWRLRDSAKMGFLDIVNFRYQTGGRVGSSTDLKNTRGISWLVYTDEQDTDLITELRGQYEGPVTHRFVNPKGFNIFMHNWNEYSTNWDVEAPNCWATSIRVDDESGNYGMHYLRRVMSPFRGGTSTGTKGIQIMGGGTTANAGSLFNEELDDFYTVSYDHSEGTLLGGKLFPKITDPWDMPDTVNTQYTDLNTNGIVSRLDVYNATDSQPVLYGNTRTSYTNTEYRLNRTLRNFLYYEDTLLALSQVAYGDVNAVTTFDGSDIVITFTGSGTLTVEEEVQIEYLIAGGGGSGGAQNNSNLKGGGGGGGGFTTNYGGTKVTLAAGTYPVVIGAGGVFEWGTYGTGTDGGSSSFNGITVPGGGGGGGSTDLVVYTNGNSGGCGGGGAGQGGTLGGAGSAYGYAGGDSQEVSGSAGGSGGGGAGGAGTGGSLGPPDIGGDGGVGVASSITGTSVYYCGGGGGGTAGSNQGSGGLGGGGNPRSSSRDGEVNTGGGGGGGAGAIGGEPSYPGNGGSGVVIIRVTGA